MAYSGGYCGSVSSMAFYVLHYSFHSKDRIERLI